ncbi:hypothetical protein M446_0713 [Methylobacterium sp. 4-46]|uniref:hypothetical protein n=1 Tax=unclassified Methylobacterium TaxID=2615210 RepID=UPI000165C727|nr:MULTISPECIES: hypothetical protein [Methylobacterium]ACA15273.1 hypothetical protein M446_0713 [Methylobacterium sp. 4-46]WFT81000.1 hypothetical protein QA634_03605 [Methylobacterium nodulans]
MKESTTAAPPSPATPATGLAAAPAAPARPGPIPDMGDPGGRRAAIESWLRSRRPTSV